MGRFVFKLPDVGEGTAEAELVAWHVAVGDMVEEDQIVADIMTDKATVEITAPVSGKVLAIHGEPGQMVPVRGPLVEFEVEGAGNASDAEPVTAAAKPEPAPVVGVAPAPSPAPGFGQGGQGSGSGSGVGSGSGPGAGSTRARVLRSPPVSEIRANHPRAARSRYGNAALSCVVRLDQRLEDCRVISETPAGLGFGEAALRLVDQFRVLPPTEGGRPVEGQRLVVGIDFGNRPR